MALFERNQVSHRSTLSRFLAALDQSTVEALRTLCARGSAGSQPVCISRRPVRPDGTEQRTTEFAPAREAEAPSTNVSEPAEAPTPAVMYGPPQWARVSFTHGFPGSAFTPQPDGTLRCPANHPLYPKARRPERDGSDAGSCMQRASAIAVPGLMPGTVSRKQHYPETTTGKCGVVAAQCCSLGCLASF
jgi:hypothetical protein